MDAECVDPKSLYYRIVNIYARPAMSFTHVG